ncbi:MAG: glycosyltransferase family 1 protein [Candidatus Sumerlaeia bacterium]|nr:glycosyltransferase family 1 protein [Candidatus Sumerlaeia bacterium]
MSVFLDARYLDGRFSGIGTYSKHLIEHLAKLDQTTRYQVLVRPTFHQALNVGDNFELLTYAPQVMSFQTVFLLHKYLEEFKPSIVHALAPMAPIFYEKPLLVTLHDLQPIVDPMFHGKRHPLVRTGYQLFYRWAYPTVLAKAKWVLCDSYATQQDALEHYPGLRPKLIVSHLGIEQAGAPPLESERQQITQRLGVAEAPYFLYYGSSRPNKNLLNLVKAWKRFQEIAAKSWQQSKLILVVSGSRFLRDVERWVRRNKLSQQILIHEPLEAREHRALLAGAHALLFPTKFEGFGFPTLEAMQLSIPVLASTHASLPEICGNYAVLVDPDDVEAMAKGIHQIATQNSLRERLKAEGPLRAAQFPWSATAQTALDVYNLLFQKE